MDDSPYPFADLDLDADLAWVNRPRRHRNADAARYVSGCIAHAMSRTIRRGRLANCSRTIGLCRLRADAFFELHREGFDVESGAVRDFVAREGAA